MAHSAMCEKVEYSNSSETLSTDYSYNETGESAPSGSSQNDDKTLGLYGHCDQQLPQNGYLSEKQADISTPGLDDVSSKSRDTVDAIVEPRLYKRRWLMVLLFASYSLTNAYQWIHLNIVGDKILFYYNESLPDSTYGQEVALDWLSMVYMLAYIPLIFPATWLLDRKGLRLFAIIGSFLNATGAWIKCAAIHPSRFAVLMTAQTICAVAQVFILGLPAEIAAVWFGPDEVSTATSVGVFGNQVGVALGFLIPPEIVTNDSDTDVTGKQLNIVMYSGAAITTVLFILVLIFFRGSPPVPPSLAQQNAANTVGERGGYLASLRRLVTNLPFVILFVTYGLNTGSFYAISTLLNPIILHYFDGMADHAGRIGLTIVLSGLGGSLVAGIWLDKTKFYKSTTVVIYIMSCGAMIVFTFILSINQIWIVYLCGGILGFFMTGYLPVGFEFAAELTYPEPEGTTSGLLNASAQVFGIVLTIVVRTMHSTISNGFLAGNLTVSAILLLGIVGTCIIRSDLKRQKAQHQVKEEKADVDQIGSFEKGGCSPGNITHF